LKLLRGGLFYELGLGIAPGDFLDATGLAYVADAQRMHANKRLADDVLGRVVRDGAML